MFLKDHANITGKHLCWHVFLINFQASNLQSVILIKKETPALVFCCEFCESLKNTFFTEQFHMTASVTLILLKYDFQFIVHFSSTFVTLYILLC